MDIILTISLLSLTRAASQALHIPDTTYTAGAALSACGSPADMLGAKMAVPVSTAMRSEGITDVWTPLRRRTLGIWTWLDGQPVDREFAKQDWPKDSDCGMLNIAQRVVELKQCASIGFRPGYLCETTADGATCPSVKDCVTVSGRHFLYQCNIMGWHVARQSCARMGMRLAVVRSQTVINKIHKRLRNRPCSKLWVGLRLEDWIDDSTNTTISKSTEQLWDEGEPAVSGSGNCVKLTLKSPSDPVWRVVSCDQQLRVVCATSSTTSHSVDVNTQMVIYTTQATPTRGLGGVVWAVLGIVIAVVVVVVVILVLWRRKRRMSKRNGLPEEGLYASLVNIAQDYDVYETLKGTKELTGVDDVTLGNPEVGITAFIPKGSVPVGQTYKLQYDLNVKLPTEATIEEGQRVISPAIEILGENKLKKPIQITLPHNLTDSRILKEICVYHRDHVTGAWDPVESDYEVLGKEDFIPEDDYEIITTQDPSHNDEITFKAYPKNVEITTSHFGQWVCTCNRDRLGLDLQAMVVTNQAFDGQKTGVQVYVLDKVFDIQSLKEHLLKTRHSQLVDDKLFVELPPGGPISQQDQISAQLNVPDDTWTVTDIHGNTCDQIMYIKDIESTNFRDPYRILGEFVLRRKSGERMSDDMELPVNLICTVHRDSPAEDDQDYCSTKTNVFTVKLPLDVSGKDAEDGSRIYKETTSEKRSSSFTVSIPCLAESQ